MKAPFAILALLVLTMLLAQAELEFQTKKKQLKATPADERIEVSFAFKNTGSTAVTISEVDGNCGCVSADTDKKQYAKGESGTINAVFTIGSKEGKVTNKLWVTYVAEPAKDTKANTQVGPDGAPADSAPPGKTEFLTLEMDIPTVISVEPKNTVWTLGEEPAPRQVIVKVDHDQPINIREVKSSRENVTVTTKEVTPGREYVLTLTPKTTDKVQLGMLTIVTDSKITKHQKKMAFFTVSRTAPGSTPGEIVPPLNSPLPKS